MDDWRTAAANQHWHTIRTYGWSSKEREELWRVLQDVVPKRIYGDGVEAYEDFILPRDAKSWPEYHAALLLEECAGHIQAHKPDISNLEAAHNAAVRVLTIEGLEFEGFDSTYLYPDPSGEILGGQWAQLRSDIAQAIFQRREEKHDAVYSEDEETFHQRCEAVIRWENRYPWRKVRTLRQLFRRKEFDSQTKLGHALSILDAHYTIKSSLRLPDEPEYDFHDEILIEEAIGLGVHWEALKKKSIEFHALRGIRTRKAASDGGKSSAAEHRKRSLAVINTMVGYIDKDHSANRSAELAFRSGIGTSPGANYKLWQRHRAKS